jgi:hypothetical protein
MGAGGFVNNPWQIRQFKLAAIFNIVGLYSLAIFYQPALVNKLWGEKV